ncbi:hypothetical protein MAA_11773 [Metarhizium robertsii ARSEF 23]|uniref:PKS/mFAS DH domain-containing protein n=1 Tax=Metarhizium robertsii (strain ARSEF 23 / ATCC MYA-3075) TaxID=655844 RepID=A0A0B2XGI5_METRA|nr:uncharacterized protein MAA_11773 [Metarhizium robertsii ARSEF 23]KHO10627.1 hypothetical protein MAA_11773 [Metarhizium robertsii ARSEF 23]
MNEDQIIARTVKTGGRAYHSFHMKPAANVYNDLMHDASSHLKHCPRKSIADFMVSSVTNAALDSARPLDADYWCANLVSPVKFRQAVQTIGSCPVFKHVDLIVVEIGPHSALKGPVKQMCHEHKFDKMSYLLTIERGASTMSVSLPSRRPPPDKIQIRKGKLLVDLPIYQWNYVKELWAEPRQSKEQRAPQHLRHDVLGSRMPGGSKNEPTWRNRLRQIDLPWLKHHSLGGEAVFPAARYFGMATEAVTQMKETSSSPVEISGYTLRDVIIKAALVIPDDNYGIETLFSLRPGVHTDWWAFQVSSWSQDGHWRSHMTGIIDINVKAPGHDAARHAQGVEPGVEGRRIRLRTVFLGYAGHPHRRQAFPRRRVISRQEDVGPDRGRVTLRLASLHNRLVPSAHYRVHLRWQDGGHDLHFKPPTKAQLQNPEANAYSWTEERGVRLTINETQLVGSDGQLLLSLEGMRCVAYEAAVPQIRGTVLKEQPFMKMGWNVDMDTLTSASPVKSVGLADLVALAAWKNPGGRVLEFGALNSTAICQATELINYTATATSKPGLEALEDTIAGFDHATAINGLKAGQFNLIIPGTLTDPSKLASLLAPGGRIVSDQSTLSSLGKDFSILNLSNGIAIATGVAEQKTSGINGVRTRSIAIIYRNKPTEIPCKLVKACNALGSSWLARLADASIATSEHVVLTYDLERPLILELEPSELAGLHNIVSNASSDTWVTAGGLMKGATPEQAMASGVARSVTSEMASLDFTTLDLGLGSTTTDYAINEIDKESEYCLADGLVDISRLVPDATLNQEYGPQNSIPKATPFKPSDKLVATAKAVKVTFSHDERDDRTVGADQIHVQVMLSGVNKEHVLVMEGADSLTTFSHEIYGAVVQKGVNVEVINVGDRVFGFSADRLATFQTVSASMVQKAEQGDVPEELVTLPLAYATAIHGLTTLARVEAGEIVLILHGTGDSGAAAITISKKTKAQTYVAVRSVEEAARVAAAFDLPAENIIPQLDSNLMMRFKERTGGRVADVIFSSAYVSPTISHECWRQIAAFGRFIEIGRKTGLRRSTLDTLPPSRGASYLTFNVLDLYRQKERLLSDYLLTAT